MNNLVEPLADTANGERWIGAQLLRPVWVVLQRGTVELPGTETRPGLSLGLADLELLARLGSGDAVADGDLCGQAPGDAAGDLIADLGQLGLIGTDLSTHWSTRIETPVHGSEGAAAGLDRSNQSADLPPLVKGLVLVLSSPLIFRLSSQGFDYLDHDGHVRIRLSPRELLACTAFSQPVRLAHARDLHRERLGDQAMDREEFNQLVDLLRRTGLLHIIEPSKSEGAFKSRVERHLERGWQDFTRRSEIADRFLAEQRELEAARIATGLRARTPVIPVSTQAFPLLSLGMCVATARAQGGAALEEHFQFLPDWMNRTLPNLTSEDMPGIFLYSNYLWTTPRNHEHADRVKAINPHSLVIQGGPDVPKYKDDLEAYFAINRSIDIAVIGEGEATFAELLQALAGCTGDGPADLSSLHDVAGIAFRHGGKVIRTGERARIEDVDSIPSPYLTGLFDSCGDVGFPLAVIETNRGCPYGCTFCDWGSATLSRIRMFSLERVFAELEWCATHRANGVYLGDANFGIFPRDVEIAEKVVELRQRYGYPRVFETNYAKNTVKYLGQIVTTLSDGGILSSGLLSLQSMDSSTLKTIRRSNIKLEKYEALAREFRNQDLPLNVDIMMGLPGSTRESFQADLQQCVDREVRARVFPTQLLVNSPMNDPEYREANQIVTSNPISASWGDEGRKGERPPIVIATSSFSRADYEEMAHMRVLFILLENFGVLRLTSRFVRQACGLAELDFYMGLRATTERQSTRWPTIAFALETLPGMLMPPGSWRHFIDELRDYLIAELGIEDDSALDTILTVQHALLPAPDRVFPLHLDLQHDVAAWHLSRFAAKDEGHLLDWPMVVPPLKQFGPARFTVEDPQRVCELGLGASLSYDPDSDWELGSPIARPMTRRQEYL